jgi:GNAT superfamily N-acetyltransferase
MSGPMRCSVSSTMSTGHAPTLRVLRPGDEPALEAFLVPRTETSMFLRANWRAAGLEDHGKLYQGTYLAAFQGGEVIAVAAHFWQGNIILQAPAHLPVLLRELPRHCARPVKGLLGPWGQVAEARELLGLKDAPTTLEGRDALFTLSLADLRIPEPLQTGAWICRRAEPRDLEVMARYRHDFRVEAIGEAPGEALLNAAREMGAATAREGSLYLLEDAGRLVATTMFNARLPDIVQIGGVYTPPELRGRGYGRAVVAGSLLAVQAEGVSRTVLFTREEGPARRAYEGLGFRLAGDYGLVMFR